jgi:hypothetical protein
MSKKAFALALFAILPKSKKIGDITSTSVTPQTDIFHNYFDVASAQMNPIDFITAAPAAIKGFEHGATVEEFMIYDPETRQEKEAFNYIDAIINDYTEFSTDDQTMFSDLINFITNNFRSIQRLSPIAQVDLIAKAAGITVCISKLVSGVKSACTAAIDVSKWTISLMKSFYEFVTGNGINPNNIPISPVVPPIAVPTTVFAASTVPQGASPRTIDEVNNTIKIIMDKLETRYKQIDENTTVGKLMVINGSMTVKEMLNMAYQNNIKISDIIRDERISSSFPTYVYSDMDRLDPKGERRNERSQSLDIGGTKSKRRTTKRRKQSKKKTKRRKTYNKRRRSSSRKR